MAKDTSGLIPYQGGENWKGNKNGRPKGSKNSSTIIRKWFKAKTKTKHPDPTKGGKIITVSLYDIVVLKQIEKAMNGDTTAFNALLDRLEGKAVQPLHHEPPGNVPDNPLAITHNVLKITVVNGGTVIRTTGQGSQ